VPSILFCTRCIVIVCGCWHVSTPASSLHGRALTPRRVSRSEPHSHNHNVVHQHAKYGYNHLLSRSSIILTCSPANYGYQGAYSTTSYGNQNAATEGGGFMNGSQSGSQDSPGGSKVCLLPLIDLPLLITRKDVCKGHVETSHD